MKAYQIILTFVIAAVITVGSVVMVVRSAPQHAPDDSRVGGQANSDNILPYFKINGVARYMETKKPITATSTVCALRSPTNATSTLKSATVQLDVASSTATSVDIAKSNTPFATTTAIGSNYAVGAGAQAFINASTSPGAGAVEVFSPGQYLVVGMRLGITAGDAGTGFVPQGTCSAVFETADKI